MEIVVEQTITVQELKKSVLQKVFNILKIHLYIDEIWILILSVFLNILFPVPIPIRCLIKTHLKLIL